MTKRTKLYLAIALIAVGLFLLLVAYQIRQANRTYIQQKPLIAEVKPSPRPTPTPELKVEPPKPKHQKVRREGEDVEERAPRRATVPTIPEPWRPGEMSAMFAGDIVPIGSGSTFKVPSGYWVALLKNAMAQPNKLETAPCHPSSIYHDCQRDWIQADGTVLRGYFYLCNKVTSNPLTAGPEASCAYQKQQIAERIARSSKGTPPQ